MFRAYDQGRRPNLYVIAALKRKYGERKGEFAARDMLTDCERIRADMAHLAAVLAMFEPGVNLAAIRPLPPLQAPQRPLEPHGAGHPTEGQPAAQSLRAGAAGHV